MIKNNNMFDKIYEQHTTWSVDTFGKRNDPTGPINHLIEEVNELKESPYDETEYADCFLLLLGAWFETGRPAEELLQAAADKIEVNRNRKWGPVNKHGVSSHI